MILLEHISIIVATSTCYGSNHTNDDLELTPLVQILILIFAEVLGLYGLIVALILNTNSSVTYVVRLFHTDWLSLNTDLYPRSARYEIKTSHWSWRISTAIRQSGHCLAWCIRPL